MAGMIRLRPTQIILTGEEVNKTLHKSYPTVPKSQTLSVPLQWDHNVTFRKGRGTMITEKAKASCFGIHEDSTTLSEADSDEISEMSDFSFGPILLDINPSDTNSVIAEANCSSEDGDEGSGGDSVKSASWDGEYDTSVDTLTNNSIGSDDETLIPSTLNVGGSNFLLDRAREQDAVWEIYSDTPAEHEFMVNGATHDTPDVYDFEYQADAELMSIGDDAMSGQDSDAENCAQESYSLPMDGAGEHRLGEIFADLDLYASPASPAQKNSSFREKESPSSRTPGFLEVPDSSTNITPTPPSVRRLLNEIPPRLEDVIGLSPRHLALSRAILARYRSDHTKNSIPSRSNSSSIHEVYSRDLSPNRSGHRSFSEIITTLPTQEYPSAGIDDSDGRIQILGNNPWGDVNADSHYDESNVGFSDEVEEYSARILDR
ncbi:uncharacterized protein H6S33_004297 [Morchella sextelata]|uniref:uncharacterized protein n=1 Tax=Morchella sextelata TaxID=1174677 RepID=UPI001D037D49|nr:uncharacterized protein H6S33_004297 [Morchella sextelata]KAH0605840.1 hypothetical protein H6S33_004297 [Morchella sextelata]